MVAAFLNEEIRFVDIFKTLATVMGKLDETLHYAEPEFLDEIPNFLLNIKSLEDAIQADQWGRKQVGKVLELIN